MKRAGIFLLVLGLAPSPAQADERLNGQPLSEAELRAATAMFRTPLGIDISFTVDIRTEVNGQIALRTLLRPGLGPLEVYVPAAIDPNAAAAPHEPLALISAPVMILDRTSGVNIRTAPEATARVNFTVGAVMAGAAPDADLDNLVALDAGVLSTGDGSQSALGQVTIQQLAGGPQVILEATDLQIRHLLGSASTIVANTANDRAIDTTTTVSLQLPDISGLSLGSVLSRIEDSIQH